MLTVTRVTKKFGNDDAVQDISFRIEKGEIYALIGPNGSGKTTLVKSISGLLRIDSGEILVDGVSVMKSPQKTKSVIGYIPDEPSAWVGMTGEEFLHVVGALFGVEATERASRISELLKRFSLERIATQVFDDYSRGSKQKFSIISALLHEPTLLLVDEPIVGLDPESATIAKALLREFADAGGSVLLVTHTLPVAEEIASRIGLLHEGKLVAEGDMTQLRERAGL